MRRPTESVSHERRPEVIVDFASREGLLFVIVKNIGTSSAYRVTIRFDKPFHGLDGRKCVSDLQLFRRLEFLPPGKEFSQFVDPVAAYLKRREPTKLTAAIAYRDRAGQRFEEAITHDLRIFADLGDIRTSR